MKPNDKPVKTADGQFEAPELTLVIGGEKFPKPGLETAFVDYSGKLSEQRPKDNADDDDSNAGLIVCSCNRVYVNSPRRKDKSPGIFADFVESLGKVKISEKSGSSGGGRGGGGCRCAPVS
jgi:hypothetical protein